MGAREILLLAAEDAFEFERWHEAGPVTSEIDPEATAAEIVEYEALGIPLPRELDVLRRELEFSPTVREAIRSSSALLRRNGRAEAFALVGLGPQQLMSWGGRGVDPRLLMMIDPRLGVDLQTSAEPRRSNERTVEIQAVPTLGRGDERVIEARVPAARASEGAPGDLDDEDDEFESAPRRVVSSTRVRPRSGESTRSGREWEEDDDSLIAVRARPAQDRTNTLILGGVSLVAVVSLLWIAFGNPQPDPAPAQAPPMATQTTPLPEQVAPPAVATAPIEPTVEAAAVTPAPVPTSHRSTGGSRGGSSAALGVPTKAVNPFSTYDAGVLAGGQPGGTATPPAPAPALAPTPSEASTPAPAPTDVVPPSEAATLAPAEPAPTPAPEAPPPEPELTKSKMTPAIRDAITSKVDVLQRCYDEALVGKPDLQGRVVFTISLDQDGVVQKVEIGKDAVGYGVASCAAKKIRKWTLPSAGIPIIFDLPFDFQQPK